VFLTDNDSFSIRKISPDGIITTLVDNVGGWGVAVDGSAGLYIVDWSYEVRKVFPDGSIICVARTGTSFAGDGGPASDAQLAYPSGVAVDSAGELYIADRWNYRIRRISSNGIINTVAGNGTAGNSNSGDGGHAQSAHLTPASVAADALGNLFVADSNRIRKVSPDGTITTVAGNGNFGFFGDGGLATNAPLAASAVAVGRDGSLFILGGNLVRKVSPAGIITTVAGNGTVGFSGDGGPATSASLGDFSWCNSFCGGIGVDQDGSLYIADPGNSRVRKVSPDGIMTTVAGNGTEWFSGDGGPATSAQLDSPAGVAVDGAGNLFIAESGRVRKVSTNGIIQTVAGGVNLSGSSADGNLATSASLSFPVAVAVDDAGNLFIADPGWYFYTGEPGISPADNRIRKVAPDGIITTIAGVGTTPGHSGNGGAAVTAKLNGPTGLAVDGAGKIYVADAGNNAVRVLRPANKSVLIGTVVNAANQRTGPVSPGELVVIYGAGLGPHQLSSQPNRYTTDLGGTTVSFNGNPAQILYSSATQVGVMVPDLISGTTAQLL
jgi:sugar lactone lactonase YvrE